MANLTICSYSLYGLNQGKYYLFHVCVICDVIIIRGYWLLLEDLDRFSKFNSNLWGFRHQPWVVSSAEAS